mgnify:CR=1 FL=1
MSLIAVGTQAQKHLSSRQNDCPLAATDSRTKLTTPQLPENPELLPARSFFRSFLFRDAESTHAAALYKTEARNHKHLTYSTNETARY